MRILVHAVLLLLASTSCWEAHAAESRELLAMEDDVPGNVLSIIRRDYVRVSEKQLTALDRLIGQDKLGGRSWESLCNVAITALVKTQGAVNRIYAEGDERRAVPPPDLQRWFEQEREAWNAARSVGYLMMHEHDALLEGKTMLVRELANVDRVKETLHERYTAVEEYAKTLLDLLATTPTIASADKRLLAKILADLLRVLQGSNGGSIASKLIARLHLQQAQGVRAVRRQWDKDRFATKVEAAIRKKIDPDGKGTFHEHERRWEAQLEELMEGYEALWEHYDKEVKPLEDAAEWKSDFAIIGAYLRSGLPGFVRKLIGQASDEAKRIQQLLDE